MNKKIIGFFVFLLFFLTPTKIFSQVVINEFNSASSDDWVELFNNSSEQIDLSGYLLIDGSESGNTKTLSCTLASKGFLVIDWSNKLNNSGDIIKLKNGDTVIDCIAYGDGAGQLCEGKTSVDLPVIELGKFGARTVDGEESWVVSTTSTKDNPNDGSQKGSSAVCFTPTEIPEPTETPESTDTPTPSQTPTPTKTPTPKPTQKNTQLTPTTSIKDTSMTPQAGEVLGATTTPVPSLVMGKSNNLISGAKIALVLGLLFCGMAVLIFTQRFQDAQTKKENS